MTDADGTGARRTRLGPLGRVRSLSARVAALEREIQEARATSLRVAELTDIVAELLAELARADPERAGAILDRYRRGLGS